MASSPKNPSPILTPEEALQAVIKNAPVSISVTDAEGHMLFVAGKGLELLGEDTASLVGLKVADVFPEEKRIPEMMKRVFRGEVVNAILEVRGRSLDVWMSPVRDKAGKVSATISIATDVTDRERLIRKMEETERLLSLAEKAARFGFWYSDPSQEGRLVWSDGTHRIFGVSKGEFDGTVESFFKLIHPDDLAGVRKASLDALSGKGAYNVEHRVVRPDGQVRWVHQEAEVAFGDDGKPRQMVGMAQDITERKLAEEERVESEKRYHTLIETSPLGVAIHQDARFIYVNKAFTDMLGIASSAEMTGREIYKVVHPDFRDIVRQRVEGDVAKGRNAPMIEEKFLHADGTPVDVEVITAPLMLGGRNAAVTYVHDIGRRKASEAELRESEEKYRMLFETADDAIFVVDTATNKVVNCNKKAEVMLGRAREEIIGMEQPELHPPGLGERYAEYFRKYIATGKVVPEQMYAARKDGGLVPIKISASIAKIGGKTLVTGVFHDVTEEVRVAEDLRRRNHELEQFVKVTTGREVKMMELKRENEDLRKRLEERLKRNGD